MTRARRTSALFVMIAIAPCAHASLRMFFTSSASPWGLADQSLAFRPTQGDAADAASYQISAFPPLDAWGSTPSIHWQAGEFAYIWVRFHDEPANRRIQGLWATLDDVPAELAYYIMDDTSGDSGLRRWECSYTLPDAPEFKQQRLLSAAGAHGIVKSDSEVDAWNLYDSSTHTALLGAVRYDSNGSRSVVINPGTWPYPVPPPPWWVTWETGSAHWIPEPVSATLVIVAAAFLRRRAA